MRIAVVGSGFGGIAAASVLRARGHEVVVFERQDTPGGVWALAYPEVRLQNIAPQYRLTSFDWPFEPDLHPTGSQILRYIHAAIEHHQLDLRCGHEVTRLEPEQDGWRLWARRQAGEEGSVEIEERFDWVVLAVGQFTQDKAKPPISGAEQFAGEVITEREVKDLEMFRDRHVAIVGFGKSALDLASFAAQRGATVEQVFRTPRWLIPRYIGGLVYYIYAVFTRFGSAMIPCWAQPTAAERWLHQNFDRGIGEFWSTIERVVRRQMLRTARGRGPEARARIEAIIPEHTLLSDMRAASALAPKSYFDDVAAGRIRPHRGEFVGYVPEGLKLDDGRTVAADTIILALGFGSAKFPYLPERYRALLEAEPDGPQLYRHVLHPRIPRLGFVGFNQSFMTIPGMEIGALWLSALMEGELSLPSVEQMEHCIDNVRAWKRKHINFEPSRSAGVNTRWQQYIDILLQELGVNPYRKLPNVLAEIFSPYGAADYEKVIEEYLRATEQRHEPRSSLPLDT